MQLLAVNERKLLKDKQYQCDITQTVCLLQAVYLMQTLRVTLAYHCPSDLKLYFTKQPHTCHCLHQQYICMVSFPFQKSDASRYTSVGS